MAIIKNTPLTRGFKVLLGKGLKGLLGKKVAFRMVGNDIIVSTVPVFSAPPSQDQKKQRGLFQSAMIYAKSSMADPDIKAAYQKAAKDKRQPNAYNIAVADFFNAPDIKTVDLSTYTGKVEDKITIKVTDDFKVTRVTVSITNANDSLVEEGEAVQQTNPLNWLFTAKVANEDLSGNKISIKAYDLPGNEAQADSYPQQA